MVAKRTGEGFLMMQRERRGSEGWKRGLRKRMSGVIMLLIMVTVTMCKP